MPASRPGLQLARTACVLALPALGLLASCGDGDKAQQAGQGGPPAAPAAPAAPAPLRPEDAARLIALENRGIGLLERFDYVAAVKPLREASALAPSWIPGRVNLALALIHCGPDKRPEARQVLAGVLRDEPSQPHAAFLSAWLAENAGESDKAIEMYRTAYRVTGEDAVCGAKLGTMLASTEGHEQEALELLTKVHQRRPALISPVNQLMLLNRQMGREAEGEAFLQLLFALKGRVNPNVDAAKVGEEMRDAYGAMGPFSQAIRDFDVPDAAAVPGAAAPGAVTAKVEDVAGWKSGDLTPGAPYLGAAAFDYDSDGDIDVFVCGGTGPAALFRNDAGTLTDVAKAAGVALTGAFAVTAGEVDVDPSKTQGGTPGRRARVDLVVLRKEGVTLLRNKGDGTFEDATAASGLAADTGAARAALLFDAEQDGDLDLFISGEGGATNRLWSNKGPGVFVDATKDSGLVGDGGPYGPAAVVDFDKDYDLDLVVSRPSAPPAIFANDRMLRFRSAETVKGAGPSPHGVLVGDFGRDGHENVVLLGDAGFQRHHDLGRKPDLASSHWLNSPGAGGAACEVDARGDGGRELVFATGTSVDLGVDNSSTRLFEGKGLANVLAADLDGDGAEEVLRILPSAPIQRVTLTCPDRGHAVTLDLEGVIRNDVQAGWSNLEGRGALVEVKAGALWQQRRVGGGSGFGCSAPTRLVVGIGKAAQADFVRIVWPDAVQQGVLDVPSGAPQVILEEQRRPDSCPLIFSWDGERWAFVTDFLGVGGVGFLVAPGVYGAPDPTESVKIDASLVKPRDGNRLVFKLTESMEEACYLDACDLLVVDHPADVTVFPDERFAGEAPFPDGHLLAYRGEILPVAAKDAQGADVLDKVTAVDRRYPDAFKLHPRLYGSTDEAVLELDFGDRLAGVKPGDGIVLYANGWIEYGYTRTTVAAAGEGFEMKVPSLEAWDAATKTWKTLVANLGYPAGFPRVMTYDLTGVVSRETPRLRIRTNFEIYWDKVWLGAKEDVAAARQTVLPAESADLRWVGYPREYSPDGRIPRIYDYGTLDPSMPWKTMEGDYTKFGAVTPLLGAADDMYVIYGKGEEIEVRFDANRLPPLADGWSRSYVLRTTGWCKGQEMYIAHGWTVEPLPFLGMSHYPYRADEHYPDDEKHREYRRTWNTRVIGGPSK